MTVNFVRWDNFALLFTFSFMRNLTTLVCDLKMWTLKWNQYAHRFFHLGVHVPFYLHFWGYKENELHFLHTRSCTMLFFVNIRPKKINSVFTVTCQKNLVSVGRDIFFYYVIGKTGNSRSRFRYFIFEKNDELCSFSTFFALNFDKKLAVE